MNTAWFAVCFCTFAMEEWMFIPANEAAEQCGISVEKLEKIAKRKDCYRHMTDADGNYDPAVVNRMLEKLAKCAAAVRSQRTNRRKQQKPKKAQIACSFMSQQETLEEFQIRFWETDEMWKEFCLNDMSEEWVRYFIRKALEFGYAEAYPE